MSAGQQTDRRAAIVSRYDASILYQSAVDSALLTYAWHTSPSPLLASASATDLTSASLTLVVSCPSELGLATVRQIEVVIPSDPSASSQPDPTNLAATAPSVASIVSSDPKDLWNVDAGAATGSFLFTPKRGTVAVGTQSLTISIPGVQVSPLVGTALVTVNEWAAATGDPPAVTSPPSGTSQTAVPKFPQGFVVNGFDATTPAVGPDFGTTLSWSGSAGATYTIQYDDVTIPNPDDPRAKPLSSNGSLNVDQLDNDPTLFTLTVTAQADGATAKLIRQKLVAVEHAKIDKFIAYPAFVGKGSSTQITWVTNADRVMLDDKQVTAPSGSMSYAVTDSTDITLTVWKGSDVDQRHVPVKVMPPVIAAFGVSVGGEPVTKPVDPGTKVTFNWVTTYAQTVTISPGVGTVAATSDPSGPVTTAVSANTTFVLTCTGLGDPVTQSVAVTVNPKLQVSVTTENVMPVLNWTSQGAVKVMLLMSSPSFGTTGPYDVGLNGAQPLGTTTEMATYTFTAYGDGDMPPVSVAVQAPL